MNIGLRVVSSVALIVGGVVGFYLVGTLAPLSDDAHAASPARTAQDVYYPGTETLGPDEMRVIACGTGHPMARPKQAASCWLVELGNGDKFIFDLGSQSLSRIAAMKIPMDFLDKVFISHLHVDHMGDLPDF